MMRYTNKFFASGSYRFYNRNRNVNIIKNRRNIAIFLFFLAVVHEKQNLIKYKKL